MKWPQIITVLLGVAAFALAVRFRGEKPASPPSSTATSAPALARASTPGNETSRALPPAFDRPGMTSRLIGLMRTYVAVVEEMSIDRSHDESGDRGMSVPILIVLENETYRPLVAADVGWLGGSLCTVRVVRVPDRGGEVEVFQTDVPLPSRADWLSAERRSFIVDWPLRDSGGDVVPGRYKVSVRLAVPDEPVVELYTRLL